MRWVARASESVTVGRSPSGTRATVTPTAKTKRSERLMPRKPATTKNSVPIPIDRTATRRVTLSSSRSSGLRSRLVRWARSAMRPNLVAIPVSVTAASPDPAVTYVPAKTRFVGLDRVRLARQGRLVDAELVGDEEVGVRRHPVAGSEQEHVARNDVLARDLGRHAVAADTNAGREHAAERLDGPLGPVFLDEREDRVDEDDGDDRRRELEAGPRRAPGELPPREGARRGGRGSRRTGGRATAVSPRRWRSALRRGGGPPPRSSSARTHSTPRPPEEARIRAARVDERQDPSTAAPAPTSSLWCSRMKGASACASVGWPWSASP